MQHGQKWLKFKKDGFCGSLTIRSHSEQSFESDPGFDDKHIHDAILEMDPEYTYVKVIHEGYKGSLNIPTIELGNDAAQNQDTLDNAILEGLAHLCIFREANTDAIVQFGYKLDEV